MNKQLYVDEDILPFITCICIIYITPHNVPNQQHPYERTSLLAMIPPYYQRSEQIKEVLLSHFIKFHLLNVTLMAWLWYAGIARIVALQKRNIQGHLQLKKEMARCLCNEINIFHVIRESILNAERYDVVKRLKSHSGPVSSTHVTCSDAKHKQVQVLKV